MARNLGIPRLCSTFYRLLKSTERVEHHYTSFNHAGVKHELYTDTMRPALYTQSMRHYIHNCMHASLYIPSSLVPAKR